MLIIKPARFSHSKVLYRSDALLVTQPSMYVILCDK